MSDDELELPPEKTMSSLFKGLQFFFQPNNRSALTTIRKRVARENSAIVNGKFNPEKTSIILVDQKIITHGHQVRTRLKTDGVDVDALTIPVLSQNWLIQSVQENKLLDYGNFKINIAEESSKLSSPSPTGPHAKKRKITKSEALVKNLDSEVINENNPNAVTIAFLKQMAENREIQGDKFKVRAYNIAIESLSKTKEHIKSSYQAIQLPGIGKSIAEKIEEIAKTHKLKELEELENDDDMKLKKLFKGIYSVGEVTSNKWIHEGMTTLKEISDRDDLNHNQRLGLQYYDDWNDRIPRKECTVHNQYLSDLIKDIDSEVEFTIGGSYRRGAKTCGDIDFIITKPNAEMEDLRVILFSLLDKMKETGYRKCSLTHPSTKWSGGCALPPEYNEEATGTKEWGKCRRVDFLMVPWRERGSAFIYFTGNDELNKRMRMIAKKKNMNLSDSGLYRKYIDENNKEQLQLIESFDEKKIFELLGVRWREPTKRNIGTFDPL